MFYSIILSILLAAFQPGIPKETRVMNGYYWDWGVIETVDGNEWMVRVDGTILEDLEGCGELVQVQFATQKTESVLDDEIIQIRRIGRGKEVVENDQN